MDQTCIILQLKFKFIINEFVFIKTKKKKLSSGNSKLMYLEQAPWSPQTHQFRTETLP